DYTAPEIKAYFTLDLETLRTCALGTREDKKDGKLTMRVPKNQSLSGEHKQGNFTDEEAFLIVWAMYKIKRFLRGSMSLRSGCAFKEGSLAVTEPSAGFSWPSFDDIRNCLLTLGSSLF